MRCFRSQARDGDELPEIPPQAEQMIMQLQSIQQQLQTFALQRQTLVLQKHEVERAIEDLEGADEKEDVYKLSGPIMVRSTKTALLKDLKERIEKMGTTLKRIEDHEKKLGERVQENQQKQEKM